MAGPSVTTAIRAMQAAQQTVHGNIERVLRGDAPEPHPDAELLTLVARCEEAERDLQVALADWRVAHDRFEASKPARPNALRRTRDFIWFAGMALCNPRSPDFYTPGEVADFFRNFTPSNSTSPLWRPRQVARAQEIVAAQDAWTADCERHAEQTGYAAIDRRADHLTDARFELGWQVRNTQATTIAGVVAKARVAKFLEWDGFESEVLFELIDVAGGDA